MDRSHRRFRANAALAGAFALFLGAMAYLVASSLVRREVPTFEPTPPGQRAPAAAAGEADTVTIDASDSHAWRFFDFDRRAVVAPPDTAGWDVAFRRYHVVPADAAADAGADAFDRLTRVPSVAFVRSSWGRDTANAALRRWYDYGMVTHLLESSRRAYVVRTREGRYAKLELLSYYCTGLRPGCMTFRFAYPLPGAGGDAGR
jgi:hypothetical protein